MTGSTHDGASERMFRLGFDGSGKSQQSAFGAAPIGDAGQQQRNDRDIGDARLALGQGAGLIEGDELDAGCLLQMGAAFEQYSLARAVGDGRENRGRSTDNQSA